jgi:UDP-glucose 4-epimerase
LKKVLITGGAGFIGSHLAEALLQEGHEVRVIDDLSTGRIENILHLEDHPNFSYTIESILDSDVLNMVAHGVDQIYHLAAAVGVRLIVEEPLRTLQTNIEGTERVRKVANANRAKILITSTSEIYGKSLSAPFSEDDDRILGSTTKTRWSYSTSKAVDEILALAYYRSRRLPVVVVRLFNTCGPRQTGQYGMVIPRFVQQALANEPITIFGDGKQTRCFCFVGDTVRALRPFNGAQRSGRSNLQRWQRPEISIEDLAKLILKMTGSKSELKYIPYNVAYEEGFEDMLRRVPNISKIRDLTGFVPQVELEQILQEVIDSFRNRSKARSR